MGTKKVQQHQRMSHLSTTWQLETAQGDLLDSPGVGAIEIHQQYVVDRWQHRQEAPMRNLVTPAWIWDFFAWLSQQGWHWGVLYTSHVIPCCWGLQGAGTQVMVGGYCHENKKPTFYPPHAAGHCATVHAAIHCTGVCCAAVGAGVGCAAVHAAVLPLVLVLPCLCSHCYCSYCHRLHGIHCAAVGTGICRVVFA